MKKSELKAIIKECIKEEFLTGGLLSNIIKETLIGLQGTNVAPIVEARAGKPPAPKIRKLKEGGKPVPKKQDFSKKINESKQRMIEAMGAGDLAGVFKGTTPLSSGGSPGSDGQDSSPLKGLDPNNPGVDLSQFGFDKE